MASVRRRDPKDPKSPWVVEYTNPDSGKRVRATPKSGLKRDADELRRKIEREIETGTHMQVSLSPTVVEVTAAYMRGVKQLALAGDYAAETYRSRERVVRLHIDPHLGHFRVSALTLPKLQSWIDKLGEGGAGLTTIEQARQFLYQALSEACRLGMIGHNVMASARLRMPRNRKKQIEIPNKDEIRRIIECSPYPFRLIVSIAISTGLRQGEIRGLTWDKVDLENGVINVRQQAGPNHPLEGPRGGLGRLKTPNSIRDVAIGSMLVEALKEWRPKCRPSKIGFVFPNRSGKPIEVTNFRQHYWMPTLKRAGLLSADGEAIYSFHALRHVYASLMIEQGVPAKELQRSMGHSTITMTFDVYGHLFEKHAKTRPAVGVIESEFFLAPAA